MNINASGWRPALGSGAAGEGTTFTGNKALMLEEPLIFEIGDTGTTGVDFDEGAPGGTALGGLERAAPIGLAGLTEP